MGLFSNNKDKFKIRDEDLIGGVFDGSNLPAGDTKFSIKSGCTVTSINLLNCQNLQSLDLSGANGLQEVNLLMWALTFKGLN